VSLRFSFSLSLSLSPSLFSLTTHSENARRETRPRHLTDEVARATIFASAYRIRIVIEIGRMARLSCFRSPLSLSLSLSLSLTPFPYCLSNDGWPGLPSREVKRGNGTAALSDGTRPRTRNVPSSVIKRLSDFHHVLVHLSVEIRGRRAIYAVHGHVPKYVSFNAN